MSITNTTLNTLVIGASDNEERYSNMAVRLLNFYKHNVLAIGNKETIIGEIAVQKGMPNFENVDTITLYLSPKNQEPLYDYIIALKPRRIIFNPGTENIILEELANKHNIQTIEACTLVMLKTNQY